MGTYCFAPVWGPANHSHIRSLWVLPRQLLGRRAVCVGGECGWPQRGLSDAAWSLLRTRVGTFTPSHSLASLAGTGDRTPCPHHLLPLPSLLQPGWELGKLATGAEEAMWRSQSPHMLVSVSTHPPIAHPSLGLASRSSIHTLPSLPTRHHPSGLHHCRGAGQACLLPTAPGLQPPRHPRTS